MYVCVCQAVTERQIRQAAHEGARSLKDLYRDLGISRDCGRCANCARHCLNEALSSCQASNTAIENHSLAA